MAGDAQLAGGAAEALVTPQGVARHRPFEVLAGLG